MPTADLLDVAYVEFVEMVRGPFETRADALHRVHERMALPWSGPMDPVHALICGLVRPASRAASGKRPPPWWNPRNVDDWAALAGAPAS